MKRTTTERLLSRGGAELEKVLVVGNGAREHVIAETIARSPQEPKVFAFMKARNPGIVRVAAGFSIGDITDPKMVVGYAKETGADLAVVGPENPLGAGVVDALEDAGISCASPLREAARIETSKLFARSVMDKYRIPGNNTWRAFEDPDEAERFIDSLNERVVIKPVGLTGGKGVKVVNSALVGQLKDLDEAKDYARKVIEEKIGGQGRVLVEKYLSGQEFTLQAFVDGEHVIPTPVVQDNKFAYEGDTGPFTGSMGSFSDSNHLLPFMTATDYFRALDVMKRVVDALRNEGFRYKGVLYGGFILTSEGPKILEFNARWGDPEAMNVLPLLKDDFLEICWAMAEGALSGVSADFEDKATVCKYIAPEGYPTNPVKGERIVLGDLESTGALIHFASVDERDGEIYMSSSRALACTGIADTMADAERMAEEAAARVKGRVFYRRDIGRQELLRRRTEQMRRIRRG